METYSTNSCPYNNISRDSTNTTDCCTVFLHTYDFTVTCSPVEVSSSVTINNSLDIPRVANTYSVICTRGTSSDYQIAARVDAHTLAASSRKSYVITRSSKHSCRAVHKKSRSTCTSASTSEPTCS